MEEIRATLMSSAWRRVDIKLAMDDDLHVLRWRRGFFVDEVLFDDRRVATSKGVFGRDSTFGFAMKRANGKTARLIFTVDAAPDYMDSDCSMRPSGVRLETADETLLAEGSLSPKRRESFSDMVSRAARALGLT